MAEAERLRARPSNVSVARNLRDNLLVLLCAYPLGEAGPRSGLDQLAAFARATERERGAWENELGEDVGRHMLTVARTVTRDSRETSRWDVLGPLGWPPDDRWQMAANVFTRVIASRTVDGLLHPVLAAESLHGWPIPTPSNDENSPGIRAMTIAGRLFVEWRDDRSRRDAVEHSLIEVFRSATWPDLPTAG